MLRSGSIRFWLRQYPVFDRAVYGYTNAVNVEIRSTAIKSTPTQFADRVLQYMDLEMGHGL